MGWRGLGLGVLREMHIDSNAWECTIKKNWIQQEVYIIRSLMKGESDPFHRS